jgi:Family of unknown function (DUF5652)
VVHELGWMLIVVGIAWALLWKALALWKAARRGQYGWFVALLLINTLGLLELLYLFVFSRRQKQGDDSIA